MKNFLSIFVISLSISAYSQTLQFYTSFDKLALNLYAWRGNKIVLLSSSNKLNPITMNKWVLKLDIAYNFYALCTGREPIFNKGITYLNNRATIAEVPTTCGAGCGYLGWSGIELQTSYFSSNYNYINKEKEIIPQNIITKAPSAELRPNQKDSDSLPDYDVLDKILQLYILEREGPQEIINMGFDATLVNRIFNLVNRSEYKRQQTPPILRVSKKAFGQGRRMQIVADYSV